MISPVCTHPNPYLGNFSNNGIEFPGGADRSYGIEVAKLAGLPNEVVRRANVILKELEQGGAYQAKPREETEQVSLDAIGEAEVLAAIRRAQPDTMSPIEAMQLLYELKQKLS